MKINIPDENAPGYIRRQKKLQAFLSAEEGEKTDRMVEWLADYIEADDPIEELLDASEAEINELMKKINARAAGADPKASGNSGDG